MKKKILIALILFCSLSLSSLERARCDELESKVVVGFVGEWKEDETVGSGDKETTTSSKDVTSPSSDKEESGEEATNEEEETIPRTKLPDSFVETIQGVADAVKRLLPSTGEAKGKLGMIVGIVLLVGVLVLLFLKRKQGKGEE